MADEAEPDLLQRIEENAREESQLHHVLLFFGLALCPVWISAAVAAAAELSFSSLPDNFYGAANWTAGGGIFVTIVVAIILEKRAKKRQAELAKNIGELSSYQLGYGAVKVALGDWVYRVAAIPLAMFFLVDKVAGGGRAELTEAALFWYAQEFFAYAIGLISCFLAFCLWLGHRVQKQTAAKAGSA